MTSTTPPTKPRPWWQIVLPLALVVALTAVGTWWLVRPDPKEPATHQSTSPAPSSTSAAAASPQGVDGCLGGTDPAAAIEVAKSAPLTPEGAVEFLATTLRWLVQTPKPHDEWAKHASTVLSPDMVTRMADEAQNPPQGADSSFASTTDATYKVIQTGATTKVAFRTTYQLVAGAQQQKAEGGAVYTLKTTGGRWQLAGTDPNSAQRAGSPRARTMLEQLRKSGTPLPKGC